MFGNKPAFGTGTGFGTGTQTTFGAAKPLGTSFGSPQLFNSTQPTTSIFGGGGGGTTSLFGAAAGTSSFGQTATAPSTGFGFGGATTGNSLFGATNQQPANTGLFSNVSGSAFGTPKPTFGGFGASTSGTTLFGQTAQQTQQQPGMLFNQSAMSGTSMFGTSAFGAGTTGASIGSVNGTTVKFVPVNGSDTMMKNGVSTHISTRHLCITVMKEYENKSLEELRMEDYSANRKGVPGGALAFGAANQTSLFSSGGVAASPGTSSLFGNTTQNKSLFGTNTAGFGTATGGIGMFGQQPQQQTVSPFGTKPLGFGTATTTQSSSFGGFGNTTTFGMASQQNKSLFGQTTTPAGTSLFGGTNATAQPTTAFGTGVNFGSGFGAQNQTGVFGKSLGFGAPTSTTPAPAFSFGANTTPNAGAFSFNQQKPATTGFGAGFGTAATGFTGFGNAAANQTTGLFGQAKPQLSFDTGFGTNLNPATGSFFGNTANKPGGLGLTSGFGTGLSTAATFGSSAGSGFGASNFNFGSAPSMPNFGSDLNAAQLSSQQGQQQLLALATSPYGDSPLFRNVLRDPSRSEDVLKPTNPQAQKAFMGTPLYKVSPRLTTKVKLKPISSLNNRKSSLFDDLHEDNTDLDSDTLFVSRRNVKKLVIKSKPKTVNRASLEESDVSRSNEERIPSEPLSPPSLRIGVSKSPSPSTPLFAASNPHLPSTTNNTLASPCLEETSVPKNRLPTSRDIGSKKSPTLFDERNEPLNLDDTMAVLNFERARRDILSPDYELDDTVEERSDGATAGSNRDAEGTVGERRPHPTGAILERPGYYTLPSLDELESMLDDDGNCFVENFTIGREGYGNVYFPGITNIAKLNLDEIVHFRRKEVIIYPSDDLRPPVGCGLNKKAQITLDCVWPNDKTTRTPIKSVDRLKCMHYQDKLEEITARLSARFIEYRPETGSWVFQVNHFSKYGVQDSDDEEIPVGVSDPLQAAPPPQDLLLQQQQLNKSGSAQTSTQNVRAHGRSDYYQPKAIFTSTRSYDNDDEQEMEGVLHQALTNFPNVSPFGQAAAAAASLTAASTDGDLFLSPSQRLAQAIGTNSSMVQTMKASFFGNEKKDYDEDIDMFADRLDKQAAERYSHGRHIVTNGGVKSDTILKLKQSVSSDVSSQKLWFQPSSYEDIGTRKQKLSKVAGSISQLPMHATTQIRSPVDKLSKFTLLPGGELSPERMPVSADLQTRDHLRIVPYERSSVCGQQHLIADMSCFMGRSFRVGWGPKLSLVHCGIPLGRSLSAKTGKKNTFLPFMVFSTESNTATDLSPFSVTIEMVSTEFTGQPTNDNNPVLLILSCLEAQLALTRIAMENGCPLAAPAAGVGLIHLQSEIASRQVSDTSSKNPDAEFLLQCKAVWDLTVALWGRLHPSSYDEESGEQGAYAKHMARREALTDWLQATNSRIISAEVETHEQNGSCEHRLRSLFSHMTGLQVEEAVSAAQKNHDFSLSVLLSQAGGNCDVRDMLQRQLDHWEESRADAHISVDRLKVYALLAGCLVWPSSMSLVNTCEHLDWKRAFALHLWYHCLPTATIEDAVAEYDNAHKGYSQFGSYAPPPLPPYVEKAVQSDVTSAQAYKCGETTMLDTCYLLLKLYGDRLYPLDQLLTPNSSVPDPLDHRLSWLLSQALRALGYENLSQLQKCKLSCNFASQLISMGLWQWSIFVLLHIENASQRKSSVLDVLRRHVSAKLDDSELETFLSEKLLVPTEWIYEAKAIQARRNGDVHAEAYYLLKSEQWNHGHKLIIEHIAPDAIINECYDYLKGLLVELTPPDRNIAVSNWATGGQVFLDYIHLSQTVDRIIKGEVSAYELEGLQPEVTNLCSRVGNLRCQSAKDRLCVSEMSKKTANLLRAVLTLGSNTTIVPSRLVSAHIGKLPLPEDYGMHERKTVMQSYCQEMT